MHTLFALSVMCLTIASPIWFLVAYRARHGGGAVNIPVKPDQAQIWINGILMLILFLHTHFILSLQTDNPWISNLWLGITATHFLFCLSAFTMAYLWRILLILHPFHACFLLMLLLTEWIGDGGRQDGIDISVSYYAHIFISEFTFAFISLAAVTATAVLWREYGLKQKKNWQILHLLPPLAILTQSQTRFLMTALAFLAAGIVSGMIWSWQMHGTLILFDHKTILVIAAFAVLVLLLFSQYELGWRSKNVTRFILLSYLLILFGYHGVLFVRYILLA